MSQEAPPLLSIDDMSLEFRTRSGTVRALDHVSLSIGRGEIVGLVGESGSGKSVLCHALLGLSEQIQLEDGTRDAFERLFGRLEEDSKKVRRDAAALVASTITLDTFRAILAPELLRAHHASSARARDAGRSGRLRRRTPRVNAARAGPRPGARPPAQRPFAGRVTLSPKVMAHASAKGRRLSSCPGPQESLYSTCWLRRL